MKDPVLIERDALLEMGAAIAEQSTRLTLENLGIKPSNYRPWISQNRARKMGVSLKRLRKAMFVDGTVEYKKDVTRAKSRYQISLRDIQKLIRQPQL
jgi:hypothetical protein